MKRILARAGIAVLAAASAGAAWIYLVPFPEELALQKLPAITAALIILHDSHSRKDTIN